jgi:predicted TIM-barrel fold metal-dependent hydrolase
MPFEIVDALTVVGPWRDRRPGTPYTFNDLLAEHARFGITGRLTLHAEARDGVPDAGNAELDRLTAGRDDTAAIWTALPPRRFDGVSADRQIAAAEAAGVAMFALFPEAHGHHLAAWANGDLYGAMESVRLPLLLDIGNAQGADARAAYGEIHAIATAFPRLPVVLWNAFYMDERLQVPLLDLCPNVHVGIATVFIPTWGIEQYTARYGPGRLLFGSNWPRQSPGPLLTYVLYADVADAAKQAILGGTIRALANEVRWPVRGLDDVKPGPPAGEPGLAAGEPDHGLGERSTTAGEPDHGLDSRRAPDEEGE